jgi:hypothetical protein
VAVALGVREARGQAHATSITFHAVVELIAWSLGWGRTATTGYLNELERAGLIARRAHTTSATVDGEQVPRCDGVMLNVKLAVSPARARLTLEELRHQPRNLDADRRAGCTAYAAIREAEQSTAQEKNRQAVSLLLSWALTPGAGLKPPLHMTVQVPPSPHLAALLDLPHAAFEARGELVTRAAAEICEALGDQGAHAAWCRLLWNMLRLLDQHRLEPRAFDALRNVVTRARVDRAEGFARNAGALAMSRVKAWAVYDELLRAPMTRVGPRPVRA